MGFLPLIGIFGNLVITLVGSLAGLTPANQTLAQQLLAGVLPLVGSLGAGNTKLQDVLAVLAGYQAIIAALKSDPSLPADKLTLLNNLGAEVQAAIIAYIQAGKGYDPGNYAPVPLVP